jgi:hypothetical protein
VGDVPLDFFEDPHASSKSGSMGTAIPSAAAFLMNSRRLSDNAANC